MLLADDDDDDDDPQYLGKSWMIDMIVSLKDEPPPPPAIIETSQREKTGRKEGSVLGYTNAVRGIHVG